MSDFSRASGLVINSTGNAQGETAEQFEERIEQMRYDRAKADHNAKEAALQAQIAEATELSINGNNQLLARRMGIGSGQAINPEQAEQAKAAAKSTAFMSAPQVLVDVLPVTVGGIQLGPQQAQDMLARGEISRADYVAAVNKALEPYGQSFR